MVFVRNFAITNLNNKKRTMFTGIIEDLGIVKQLVSEKEIFVSGNKREYLALE